jgi:hypothetical protein
VEIEGAEQISGIGYGKMLKIRCKWKWRIALESASEHKREI